MFSHTAINCSLSFLSRCSCSCLSSLSCQCFSSSRRACSWSCRISSVFPCAISSGLWRECASHLYHSGLCVEILFDVGLATSSILQKQLLANGRPAAATKCKEYPNARDRVMTLSQNSISRLLTKKKMRVANLYALRSEE